MSLQRRLHRLRRGLGHDAKRPQISRIKVIETFDLNTNGEDFLKGGSEFTLRWVSGSWRTVADEIDAEKN